MNIALDEDVEDILEKQVRAGVCAAPGEFVNDLVRSIREQQQKSFEVTPELETWLLQAAEKPFGPRLLPHKQTVWIDELAVGTKRLNPFQPDRKQRL
jgi:hypothetical protein